MVTILLIILSLFTMSFIKDDIAFTAEKEGYINYAKTERKARNQLEAIYYNGVNPFKLRGFTKPSMKQEKQEEKKETSDDELKAFHFPRSKKIVSDHAKFNLHHLLTEKPPAFVKLLTSNLLQRLYGHTSFYLDSTASELVKCFTETNKPKDFLDLFPEDKALQTIYYKMLKGTNHYDLQKGIGYPPLEHFMTINSSDHYLIHYADCHEALLSALFGKENSQAIIQAEATKYLKVSKYNYTLNHKELEPYIKKAYPSAPAEEQLQKYIDFSSEKGKTDIFFVEDNNTHIIITKYIDAEGILRRYRSSRH